MSNQNYYNYQLKFGLMDCYHFYLVLGLRCARAASSANTSYCQAKNNPTKLFNMKHFFNFKIYIFGSCCVLVTFFNTKEQGGNNFN